jgi:hypothetical protein
MHIAPAYAGPGEGYARFWSYVCNISLYFCKRLFLGLEPITSGHKATFYRCAKAFRQQKT